MCVRLIKVAEDKKQRVKDKIKKTNKLLQNLKDKAKKRLDKSYALIELTDSAAKKRALVSDVRIFGMQMSGNICHIDDADYKLTLNCYNVHWGCSVSSFCDFINETFAENNALDLKLEIPDQFKDKILTKFYVLMRFNSLANTMRAIQILTNAAFEKRTLKVHHLYGGLSINQGRFSEVIDVQDSTYKLDKVSQSKSREITKIIEAPRDEELIVHDLPDSLILVEKDILIYEAEKKRGLIKDELDEIDGIYGIRRIEDRPEERWYQNSIEEADDVRDSEKYERLANFKIENL